MSKKLNIKYHYRVRGKGVEAVHILGIANGFRTYGHTVDFVSPFGNEPSADLTAEKADNSIVRSYFMSTLGFFADKSPQIFFEIVEIIYNLWGIKNLKAKIMNGGKTDFIYERYAFFNFAGAYISKSKGIPLVVEVNELSGFKRLRKQIMVPLARKIEEKIFKQASLIVVVSDFLKDQIAEMIGDDSKILVVPNGVSEEWCEQNLKDDELQILRRQIGVDGHQVIGFVGGLVSWHNFDLLLNAVADCKKKHTGVKLLLVGDGSLRESILETAEKLNIRDSIVITGMVPHKEVRKYIELFDVAIIPHTNQYRSPVKLFEYMAAGRAVVAPSQAPIVSVIDDNFDGVLFQPSNLKQVVDAIDRLLSDTEFRRKTGSRAKVKIMEKYLWRRHSSKIISRLLSICNI